MRTIRNRSSYDIARSSAYEGPYRAPTKISDIIFTIIIFGGLGIMLFYSLSSR